MEIKEYREILAKRRQLQTNRVLSAEVTALAEGGKALATNDAEQVDDLAGLMFAIQGIQERIDALYNFHGLVYDPTRKVARDR